MNKQGLTGYLIVAWTLFLGFPVYAAHQHAHESQLDISSQAIQKNQIKLLKAGQKTIQVSREVLGKIVPNANKTIYIYPRYGGIIKKMTKLLGDRVNKGELLATIENDQTLQTYPINAPFAGYIVEKEANRGEHVSNDKAIYRLADLSQVWVDLFIFRKNARAIHKGQAVIVYHDQHSQVGQKTTISYVSPLGIEQNQTMLARAVLDNPEPSLKWLPGLYVDTHVTITTKQVSVAVKNSAIQKIKQKPVVFIRNKHGFTAKPVRLGLVGDSYTQILSGVKSGDVYAAHQSFLLKADMEKEQAEHSH